VPWPGNKPLVKGRSPLDATREAVKEVGAGAEGPEVGLRNGCGRVVGAPAAGVLLVLGLLAGGAGAAGDARADTPSGDQVAQLTERVEQLTDEFARRADATAAAAARLTEAYAVIAAVDDDARAASDGAARAEGALAERVRALYALGAAAHGELALLTAPSPEDALWQMAVGAPLASRLIGADGEARRAARQRRADAGRRSAAAEAAADRIGGLLTDLRGQQEAASFALAQARGELARLEEVAREAAATQEAARRLAEARRHADETRLSSGTRVSALRIPAEFEQAYRDAARTCAGLDWTLLAAVGQVESGHGRNNGPSSAGAIGPMQFMPATFAAYAVDGDGDGRTDAWDTRDAVFSAAHYLCDSGAGLGPDGVHAALLAYNHAEWYVDLVLAAQAAIVRRLTA
jgi:membrane-bound lytic murein transglycosylase B